MTRTRAAAIGAVAIGLVAIGAVLVAGCADGSAPARSHNTPRPVTATTDISSSAPVSPVTPPPTSPPTTAQLTARPTGSTGIPRGGPPAPDGVDGTDPDAVARWVLTAWYSYDTVLDAGPSDAPRRAVPWLASPLAGIVRQATPIAAPEASWSQRARARAYATVRLTPSGDDHPPDTALQVHRAYAVTITWHPAAPGDPGQPLATFVRLSRPDLHTPWRVTDVMTR